MPRLKACPAGLPRRLFPRRVPRPASSRPPSRLQPCGTLSPTSARTGTPGGTPIVTPPETSRLFAHPAKSLAVSRSQSRAEESSRSSCDSWRRRDRAGNSGHQSPSPAARDHARVERRAGTVTVGDATDLLTAGKSTYQWYSRWQPPHPPHGDSIARNTVTTAADLHAAAGPNLHGAANRLRHVAELEQRAWWLGAWTGQKRENYREGRGPKLPAGEPVTPASMTYAHWMGESRGRGCSHVHAR